MGVTKAVVCRDHMPGSWNEPVKGFRPSGYPIVTGNKVQLKPFRLASGGRDRTDSAGHAVPGCEGTAWRSLVVLACFETRLASGLP
jgi:hypothetical protein